MVMKPLGLGCGTRGLPMRMTLGVRAQRGTASASRSPKRRLLDATNGVLAAVVSLKFGVDEAGVAAKGIADSTGLQDPAEEIGAADDSAWTIVAVLGALEPMRGAAGGATAWCQFAPMGESSGAQGSLGEDGCGG